MAVESERIITSELVKRLNQNDMRLREMENAMSGLEYGLQTLQGLLSDELNKTELKIQKIRSDTENLTMLIEELRAEIENMKKGFENVVNKEEFKEVVNYSNLMNPVLTKFATKDDVKKIIKEMLK